MAYTTENLAYIAGFLDGEGSVGVTKKSKRNSYLPQITFNNTNLKVMNFTKDKLGINSLITIKEDREKNHKKVYRIHLQNKVKCKEVLQLLIKYLIIKKKKAKLVLEFLELNTCTQGIRDYELCKREKEIVLELKRLNKKGLQ